MLLSALFGRLAVFVSAPCVRPSRAGGCVGGCDICVYWYAVGVSCLGRGVAGRLAFVAGRLVGWLRAVSALCRLVGVSHCGAVRLVIGSRPCVSWLLTDSGHFGAGLAYCELWRLLDERRTSERSVPIWIQCRRQDESRCLQAQRAKIDGGLAIAGS